MTKDLAEEICEGRLVMSLEGKKDKVSACPSVVTKYFFPGCNLHRWIWIGAVGKQRRCLRRAVDSSTACTGCAADIWKLPGVHQAKSRCSPVTATSRRNPAGILESAWGAIFTRISIHVTSRVESQHERYHPTKTNNQTCLDDSRGRILSIRAALFYFFTHCMHTQRPYYYSNIYNPLSPINTTPSFFFNSFSFSHPACISFAKLTTSSSSPPALLFVSLNFKILFFNYCSSS